VQGPQGGRRNLHPRNPFIFKGCFDAGHLSDHFAPGKIEAETPRRRKAAVAGAAKPLKTGEMIHHLGRPRHGHDHRTAAMQTQKECR